MDTNITTLLTERTSVRRYTREPIPAEMMDQIYEAVRNTPTSFNGQQFSVIDVSDQEVKEQLAAITSQKQIKTCNRLLVFCSDYRKAALAAKTKNLEFPEVTDTVDGVILGVIDASLAMMSAVVAAQALGLRTNCVGYLRTADPSAIAEILNLPEGVFVVCGLTIGFPNETPDLKPKQPCSLVFHSNRYRDDIRQMEKELLEYDAVVSQYNRTRSGATSDNDWIGHILGYYREVAKLHIIDYLRRQGYNPER